ncbi:MAG TPA: diguanylate cyclase [Terracidiphilus sp.]|jgi:diguanylate cyclase (GGDEF)-like protein/PAS domain S-box-containing protein
MTNRSELVEAALDVYPEGLALLNLEGRVVFWNRCAELMTGYTGADVVGRDIPGGLEPLTLSAGGERHAEPRNGPQPERGSLVHAKHKHGHDVPAIARSVILRDGMGSRIGIAAVFYPGEHLNALPHGDTSEGAEVRQSQQELEERLALDFEQFQQEALPFGVLWISVDQARRLRTTHGPRACETMLENVERTLANALRPGEQVGRWGDDEFLVLSRERSEVLGNHAQVLGSAARTTDFQWWGDRISITVSIGAAAAEAAETLARLLERAQAAMLTSVRAGGNHITLAPGGNACSPS